MAKRIRAIIKLQISAGQATPAPPVGPALGQHGVNIMAFVKEYNGRTASQSGTIVPAEITVYEDRSFTFIVKTPPASELVRQASGLEKGSPQALHQQAGTISRTAIQEIATAKMKDLNANSLEAAVRVIEGSARSMGIEVKG
jgi:large subunit ribosomal protein L11